MAQAAPDGPTFAHPMVKMAQQLIQMAQTLIDHETDHSDPIQKFTTKQLPKHIICNLLGLSDHSWDCQDLLPKIWQDLHQQSDQKGYNIILHAGLFHILGDKCADLEQFYSSILFHHIIKHKFILGESFNTCHHGMSILVVSLCSFTIQKQEHWEDDYFWEASHKTPDAVQKR